MGRKTNKFFICGFSGAGKSTVLAELEAPDLQKVDLDSYLSEQGQPPAVVIESEGEQRFRELEKEALSKFAAEENHIIALGGGALNQDTLEVLDSYQGYWLDTEFEICWDRIKQDPDRPLVKLGKSKLQELYQQRLVYYKMFPSIGSATELAEIIKNNS